jgi:hypothetical protein
MGRPVAALAPVGYGYNSSDISQRKESFGKAPYPARYAVTLKTRNPACAALALLSRKPAPKS